LSGKLPASADPHGSEAALSGNRTLGRLASRSGPLGDETFTYDNYSRLQEQRLDGITIASLIYDAYGRLYTVVYPTAGKQRLYIIRDTLGRTVGQQYVLGDGTTTLYDNVVRSQQLAFVPKP
jgi:YD repeat-containing protein